MDSQQVMLSYLQKPADGIPGSTPGLINYKYDNDTLSTILTRISSIPYHRNNQDNTLVRRQPDMDKLKNLCKQWIIDFYYGSFDIATQAILISSRQVIGITISTITDEDGVLCDTNGTSQIYSPPIYSLVVEGPLYYGNDFSFPPPGFREYIKSYIAPTYTLENQTVDMTYVVLRFTTNNRQYAIRLSQGLKPFL